MGNWVFMRTTYSPMSGYSGWCDIPHWGLVLTGDLALNWESGVELLTAGDVYYCRRVRPAQFQVRTPRRRSTTRRSNGSTRTTA